MLWIESFAEIKNNLLSKDNVDLINNLERFHIKIIDIDYKNNTLDSHDLSYFLIRVIDDFLYINILTRTRYDAEESILLFLYHLSIQEIETFPTRFGYQFKKFNIKKQGFLNYDFVHKNKLSYVFFECIEKEDGLYKKTNKLNIDISEFVDLLFQTKQNNILCDIVFEMFQKYDFSFFKEILTLAYYDKIGDLSILTHHNEFKNLQIELGLSNRMTFLYFMDVFYYYKENKLE